MRFKALLTLLVACGLGAAFVPLRGDLNPSSGSRDAARRALAPYRKVALSFEPNVGQAAPEVQFVSRGPGYTLFLMPAQAVLVLPRPIAKPRGESGTKGTGAGRRIAAERRPSMQVSVVRLELQGANTAAKPEGLEPSAAKANYFIGNDSKNWRTIVPAYAKVRYPRVYPGVDLVYYGRAGLLEHDFIVAPGASASAICWRVTGVGRGKALRIDDHGTLVIPSGQGELRVEKPVAYQLSGGKRAEVGAAFKLEGPDRVGFDLAAYDSSKPLVIDPRLVFSTYFGGSNDDNFSNSGAILQGFFMGGVATDPQGNSYIGGYTLSPNFPVTAGAFKTSCGTDRNCNTNNADAFVAKFDPTGALIYSTYLGGSGYDEVGPYTSTGGLAVDARGNAYVGGFTTSPDFPVTPGAFQTRCGGDGRCNGGAGTNFVTKIAPSGASLVYSSYLGGSCNETGADVKVDSSGNAYLAGQTCSSDFPTTPGAFQTSCAPCAGGGTVAFVTKLNANGSGLVYSTFLGGSFGGDSGNRIAIDAQGNAIVVGTALSTDFPTVPAESPAKGGVFQTTNGGSSWSSLNTGGQGFPSRYPSAVVVDPTNAGVVYAGTFDRGLLKSTDGGATWSGINNGLGLGLVFAIAVDPRNPQTIYAGGAGPSVFKSTDGGTTWAQTSLSTSGLVRANAIDPTTPATIYVAEGGAVAKSLDGGSTWTTTTTGLPGSQIYALTIDPVNPSTLYAAIFGAGVFKSTDGGKSWSAVNTGLGTAGITSLAIDPTNGATIYAAGVQGVWKTTSGGASWSAANAGLSGAGVGLSLALNPAQPTTLYVAMGAFSGGFPGGGFAGVFKTTDGGSTWSAVNNGLDLNTLVVALSPTAPSTLYATATFQEGFVSKLDPSGSSLVYSQFLGGNGADSATGIAAEPGGNAYVLSQTSSTNFPVTTGAFQPTNAGLFDEAVTKLTPAGAVVYSTYLGGSKNDQSLAIAVDPLGDAWTIADTFSDDFPTVNALSPIPPAGNCGALRCADVVIGEWDPTGTKLASSTYLGGSGTDLPVDITVDSGDNVYASGATNSTDFPVLNADQPMLAGGYDAFLVKIGNAAPVTISGSMEGNLAIHPGDTVQAGYDFTMPGSHPEDLVGFFGGTVTLTVSCPDGSTSLLAINLPAQTYDDPANSSSWLPSGNQSSPLVYQGSTTANPCGSQTGHAPKGAVFQAQVTSSTIGAKINVRFHYRDNSAGGWSSTVTVKP